MAPCPGAGCNAERVPLPRAPRFPPEPGRREEEKVAAERGTDGKRGVPAEGVPGGGITLRGIPADTSSRFDAGQG